MTKKINFGSYEGELAPNFQDQSLIDQLAIHLRNMESSDQNLVDHQPMECAGRPLHLSIKRFRRQWAWKDRFDKTEGSKAKRSYLTACTLAKAGVGTPAPIGFLEKWSDNKLEEAYYLSEHQSDISNFKDELISLYRKDPNCERLMTLLQSVADAVKALHKAGVFHRDLGNQNILMRKSEFGMWSDIQFIDLNRAHRLPELTLKQKAFDFSRIHLPSDFLRVMKEMYFGGVPPKAFQRWENHYRKRFEWHTRSRRFRHPLREKRMRDKVFDPAEQYPPEKDIWIWDERSGQAISTMRGPDRKKHFPLSRHLQTGTASLSALPSVLAEYKKFKRACFQKPVCLNHRIGMTIHPKPETFEAELALLRGLGTIPLWIRFYHHETESDWAYTAEAAAKLNDEGYPVSIALVQDRRAVIEPNSWSSFAGYVLEKTHSYVDWVEVGHAINRVKWGVWTYEEYRQLLGSVHALKATYPKLKLTGPAMIDFEYQFVTGALQKLPASIQLDALSHHLYVDRRGAPENKQGGFDTVHKAALVRAIAKRSTSCADKVIISEVNWPLENTGVHSPVGSPYLYPGQALNGPSVPEEVYAAYMIRYYLLTICSGMVEQVYWWRLVARGYGLVDDTEPGAWRPRAAYNYLRTFIHLLGTATFEQKRSAQQGIHTFEFTTNKGPVHLVYSTGGMQEYKPTVIFSECLDAEGKPIINDGKTLNVDGAPIYLLAPNHQ